MLFLILIAVAVIVLLICLLTQELFGAFVALVASVVVTLFFGMTVVQPGHIMYKKTFGDLSHDLFEPGLHFISPIAVTRSLSTQRQSLSYSGESTAEALTSDRVVMQVDTTIPWIMNAKAAPLMEEFYGTDNWNLIQPISRSVIRSCTAQVPWETAVSDEGRTRIAECIPTRMNKAVIVELIQAGFTEAQAKGAFTFPTAIVRGVKPKQTRILAAIATEQASKIDLRRQETLTLIAEEEANRRGNEGSGIAKMMEELPSGFTVAEMAQMIQANAAKTSADAFLNAVENGNPNITIVTGASVPAAVSAN